MTQVFVTRRIPDVGLRVLEGRTTVAVGQPNEERGLDRAALLRGVREADVLLSLLTEWVDRELLEANPGLLGVANYAVGFDNVDVATATDLGIPVSNRIEVGHVSPVDQNVAAGGAPQTTDRFEQTRLAATGAPEDHHVLTRLDGQVDRSEIEPAPCARSRA